MRTTLTLDPDVVQLIEQEMHHRRLSMKEVVNDALRSALGQSGASESPPAPYTVRVHSATLAPGVDPAGFNRLAGELEDLAILDRARERA
ncbi:MAG: antitoxin [Deltaproteobacteria bacterium]|nr:antitoxin [Deltaproteobacteria bacterium]